MTARSASPTEHGVSVSAHASSACRTGAPMRSKRDRDLAKEIESLGYAYDRTNSKGASFYIHEDTGCEVRVPSGVNEQQARFVLDEARHAVGLPTKLNKRNPQQIRERNEAEHARAKRELEAAQSRLASLSKSDEIALRKAEEEFLRAERKFRYWDRLMRSAASGAA